MEYDEFKKLAESIGFEIDGQYYSYKKYMLNIFKSHFNFYNGDRWSLGNDYYQDLNLTPFKTYFKKEMRSIKLKQILE